MSKKPHRIRTINGVKMIQRNDGSLLGGDLILPKLQDKIVMCLAKDGAMTMSETNRRIKGQNTATTLAFHKLTSKNVITEVESMEYHGRKFSKYWLSGRGMAYAFLQDMNPETVTRNGSLFLKDKTLKIYLKLHSISHEIANLLDYQMFHDGKLILEDLARYMTFQPEAFGEAEALKFLEITNLSEEFYEEWKLNLENMKKFLDKIESLKKKQS